MVKLLLKKCGIKANEIGIDLNIVSARNISEINKKYRKINEPTDVLSFGYVDVRDFINIGEDIFYLGEIFIAPSVIKKNSVKYKTVLRKEFNRVLIHGLLHLLGYDHEDGRKKREEMESAEKKIGLSLKKTALISRKIRKI